MPDDNIKGMLKEVQRSLDRSRRALENIEQRQQANSERPTRVPTLTSPTPVPGAGPSVAPGPLTMPSPAPSSVSYTRRNTASYETDFLTPARPPSGSSIPVASSLPSSPPSPPSPESSGEVASRAELSDWSSGERPSQRPEEPPSSRPESGRYTFVAPRRRKR